MSLLNIALICFGVVVVLAAVIAVIIQMTKKDTNKGYMEGIVISSGSTSNNEGPIYFVNVNIPESALGGWRPAATCDDPRKACRSPFTPDVYKIPTKKLINPYTSSKIRLSYDANNDVQVVSYEG